MFKITDLGVGAGNAGVDGGQEGDPQKEPGAVSAYRLRRAQVSLQGQVAGAGVPEVSRLARAERKGLSNAGLKRRLHCPPLTLALRVTPKRGAVGGSAPTSPSRLPPRLSDPGPFDQFSGDAGSTLLVTPSPFLHSAPSANSGRPLGGAGTVLRRPRRREQ